MSPETPPPPPPYSSFNPTPSAPIGEVKTSAAAVWSLILGGLSLVCCCLSGLPGLILGIVGLVNIGKSQGRLKGKGLAITGIILSCLFPLAPGGIIYSMRESNPQLRKFFGEFFESTQQMTKGTVQATALATGLKAYADGHANELPADLETLVTENFVQPADLESPAGGSGATFWELTEAGSKVSDLDPNEVIVKGGPLTIVNQEFYIVIRANWKVESIEAGRLPK